MIMAVSEGSPNRSASSGESSTHPSAIAPDEATATSRADPMSLSVVSW